MRQLTNSNNDDVFVFDSMSDLTSFVDPNRFQSRERSFVGRKLDSWDDAYEAAHTEWAEGIEIVERFVKELEDVSIPELRSHKRRVKFNEDDGDELDYDKLLAGNMQFWRKSEREASTGSTEVTIFVDCGANASVSSRDILWRGAAGIALTKILEEKGYKVELWMTNTTAGLYRKEDKRVTTLCRMKACSDPLDVSTLTNEVSGWFFRSTLFALYWTMCAHVGKRPNSSLGHQTIARQSDLDLVSQDDLRIYSAGVFTFDAAADMIRRELTRICEMSTFESN